MSDTEKESGVDMEQYAIKSVTFGGFDKQDVIRYIEQAAETASAAQKELQDQNDTLRAENEALLAKLEALTAELDSQKSKLEDLATVHTHLEEALAREAAQRQELEALKAAASEAAQLRPDAEAYAQFRERIGAIECEARKRAADLELSTVLQLQNTVDLFREQYQALMSTFESTASHVNSELRKVEVNLTQLPRTMDQASAELNELTHRLDAARETHQQT